MNQKPCRVRKREKSATPRRRRKRTRKRRRMYIWELEPRSCELFETQWGSLVDPFYPTSFNTLWGNVLSLRTWESLSVGASCGWYCSMFSSFIITFEFLFFQFSHRSKRFVWKWFIALSGVMSFGHFDVKFSFFHILDLVKSRRNLSRAKNLFCNFQSLCVEVHILSLLNWTNKFPLYKVF